MTWECRDCLVFFCFFFSVQRDPGGTLPHSERVVAGAAVSSTIKGRLALPTVAGQRLIAHPQAGLHASFFSGGILSVKAASSSFSVGSCCSIVNEGNFRPKNRIKPRWLYLQTCVVPTGLAHVNLLHSDVTPALSRHLPGIMKVISELKEGDSFKNLH